jgi:Peptidase family M1 domain
MTTRNFLFKLGIIFSLVLVSLTFATAQTPDGKTLYNELKAFSLTGGTAEVSGLTIQRDRVAITFTGTFYFAAPVGGKVTGAVFVGQGNLRSEVPASIFEKNNVKRLLDADVVESDFKTAVLRFTDDTFELVGKSKRDGAASPQALRLAAEFEPRVLEETGANLSARLALSILNAEPNGFFFGTFDGGKRDRFSYVFDAQTRVPTANFDINGGEKGLIFAYKTTVLTNEIWLAFYSLEDYQRKYVSYSDLNDLVDITHYDMDIDLRSPKKRLALRTKVNMQAKLDGVRAIPFVIGESLGEYANQRRNKQMRLKSARLNGAELANVQEDWESGLTVFLPAPLAKGQQIELEFEMDGDFLQQPTFFDECSYPRSNESWYPRHGYLDRATYDFTFTHPKKYKVASTGTRLSETPDAQDKDLTVTKYSIKQPVALVTFALGPFKRYNDVIKWEDGRPPIPIEFNSLTEDRLNLKESFVLAELNNSVRFFNFLFGKYPYEAFSATYHPFAFGQGFPSMLMIPDADASNKYTYAFIAHETAHQWWGNVVAWRSYRDQWLSEGFAEYSGVLYAKQRKDHTAALKLIEDMRRIIREKPVTYAGLVTKGRLFEVGPIILGHRLETSKTYGAYQALIYAKGGLVLRMMHYLFTDPATGKGDYFFDMMKDFVERYRDKVASTDDFRMVANEHFVKTPIAKQFGMTDLNWFFQQMVYETDLPSYRLEYTVENQTDGSFLLTGNVIQENVREKWFMPMPLAITLPDGKIAYTVVAAYGAKTPFKRKLPAKPNKVELDPEKWILSEKTSSD